MAGRGGDKAHDGKRRHALAAAGLADDRKRLAAPDLEREVVHRLQGRVAGEKDCLQSLHLEDSVVRGCDCGAHVAHQSRSLGSRMSRNASPSRLVPNTARLIATPGKITSHGAVRTYSAADSDSIRPQDGCGSGTPSPRNESAASTRMVEPSCAVASTISGASVFGST